MKTRAIILVSASFLIALAVQAPASALPAGVPHYPDLTTRAPFGIRLVAQGASSRRLFFANTIGNVGDGPLEVRAENDATTGITNAIQEIYTHLGPTTPKNTPLTLVSSSPVGTFVFHPAHDHWHMEDFTRYELRSINADGSTGPVVASTDKVSFCMIDTDVVNSTLTHYRMGMNHSCGQNARQGLRVGMGDTYSSSLPDQFVDITTIADGTYRLFSVADPNTTDRPGGRMLESNNANNAAAVDVVVTRQAVTPVPGTEQTGIDAPSTSGGGSSPPAITRFSPTSASVGTPVIITGVNFGGATSVAFGGTLAAFTVDSPTQITATVPAGAVSGKIVVVTPAGSATSKKSFTVT